MSPVKNYFELQERVQAVCSRVGRDPNVLLLPVSKLQPVEAIRYLYDIGIRDFAENRVQELLQKKIELPNDIRWHFIGHLQKNKVKYIADFIDSIASIDSIELAEEVSKRAGPRGSAEQKIKILVEVNISGEAQKHGVTPNQAEEVVVQIAARFPTLTVTGLMAMASFEEDPVRTRPQFLALRELRDQIAERHPELTAFKELSMGMTNDFEVAIECGATVVRIGSALFSNE
jgi:PLP dependent protein